MTSLDEGLRSAVEADLKRGAPEESPQGSPRNPEGVSGDRAENGRKRRRKEEWVFRATLTLEDPTARLNAELFGRDAVSVLLLRFRNIC